MASRLRTIARLQPIILVASVLAVVAYTGVGWPVQQESARARLGASKPTRPTLPTMPRMPLRSSCTTSMSKPWTRSGRATERDRKVFRILKPQGRNNFCDVGYDVDEKINYFRAWTIAADEKQYMAQDTDFAEVGDTSIPIMLSTHKMRVAHPPAVDVGATVICESEEIVAALPAGDDLGYPAAAFPSSSRRLKSICPPAAPTSQSWHSFKPVAARRGCPQSLALGAERHARARSSRHAVASGVGGSRGPHDVQWGDAAVDGTDNQWRAIGQWVTTLEADRPDPSPEITAQTQTLIAGAPTSTPSSAASPIHIQKNIRYFIVERGIGGLQANHAADIFRNRYGDCKDKTTLLISMLQRRRNQCVLCSGG